MYEILKDDFFLWLKGQLGQKEILAPRLKEEGYLFLPWDGEELELTGYTNTLKPVKDAFFPQWEALIRYRMDKGKSVQVMGENPATKPLILFGVRPCDARSILLLDRVFNGPKYKDQHYRERRENTFVISLACSEPASTCFCQDLGISPLAKEGSDILLVDLGDKFLALADTLEGEGILQERPFSPATPGSMDKFQALQGVSRQAAAASLVPEILSGELSQVFVLPLWDEIHQKCLNCGVCTYLCPTCHCFDISDEATDTEGRRVRSWDSCMFGNFTQHGSGHNPRPTGKERMRQRVLHKFKYFPENYLAVACVGCGRCVAKCPVNFDIREVLKRLGGMPG
ncbi:MAG: 4Fe-4S dicluster domain-containing protein [Bacillota bacterium]|uniref:4Fe-4S ferredoxin n=1 Tax=Thermanaerosceptrum fracticalcis TaxID=1712410 RepID=A0A7G6E8H1_THEFR|nr:4Fe-4S dicluster domain-containing protein [Thermanaerosceptrum fracticalcis]QNB48375.1 4Fe-4S ferredoxin [Thermanaerosceptrum fracticalcis]